MKQRNKYLKLLLEFVRFGCFTFGGGWSIIAQMQQLYAEKEKSITSQELVDLVSVAKSLPGTMIANVAMLFGYRTAGLAGGFLAVFGMVLPPMAVMIVVSFGYQAFRDNFWVSAAMSGMQAAVVPIIGSAAIHLVQGSFRYKPCYLIAGISAAVYLFADLSPIVLVLCGAVLGILICEYYERKEAADHGAA